MQVTFTIETLQDAHQARTMLDIMIETYFQNRPQLRAASTANGADKPPATTPSRPPADPALFSKEQLNAAAAVNPLIATMMHTRGKKTDQFKAELNQLVATTLKLPWPPAEPVAETAEETAEEIVETPEPPIGEALKGASAEDLVKALSPSKGTVTEGGNSVNATVAAEAIVQPKHALPDYLKEEAHAPQAKVEATVIKAATMSAREEHDMIFAKIREIAEKERGMFWLRDVVERGGGKIEKLTPEYMRAVLANPEMFDQPAT